MPKDCSSGYVVITSGDCESSISSYIAATDNSCDSSYDLIRCKSGCDSSSSCDYSTSDYCSDSSRSCSSSSKSCCSSSYDSSSYCRCTDSGCSDSSCSDSSCSDSSYYSSSGRCCRPDPYYRDAPIQRNTIITTLPGRADEGPRFSETEAALSPDSVAHPRNRSFRSVVTPLGRLKTPYSRDGGPNGVAFTMRRRNDVVNLQHEPFSGELGARGENHLAVTQSIGDLPPHQIDIPHRYRLNGVDRMGFIRVDPLDASSNLKFYFDMDPRFTTEMGDTVEIPGNSISWITSY